MLATSVQAPANWRMDLTESKVREFILQLDPDFVFFQELPGLVPYVETHDLLPANTTSHSGNIATIVRKNLIGELQSKALGRFAVLATHEPSGMTFANVHLAPGKEGEGKRLQMLKDINRACPSPALAIVGDTNMRIAEEVKMKSIGLVSARPPKPTWDSKRNRYHAENRRFTAYFTRYLRNHCVQVDQVRVHDKPIKLDGKSFYLSDHFAMSGRACVVSGNG